MPKNIYLSVIIPCYNEEKLIKKTLLETNDFLSKQGYIYEIIAVDDGSDDKTSSILESLKTSIENLQIIKNDKNLGKGYSVRKGMLMANGKFRLFMDADRSTTIDQVNNFMPFLKKGNEVVIGDRSLSQSIILEYQPLYKKILGNLGNAIIRFSTVRDIGDTQCGFKCFSDKFVKNVFPKLRIGRWGFDVEILAAAQKLGYEIKTVPVIWKNRRESKVNLGDYLFTFGELLKIKINIIKNIYE